MPRTSFGHALSVRLIFCLLGCLLASTLLPGAPAARATGAAALPPDFQEVVAFSGLTEPTVLQFAADGRIFVAEKRGVIKVFDNLSDPSPDIFADLNANVYNFWDRGLLGMALDPNFPTNPYVYVLYTHDAQIGGTAPRWGTSGVYSDPCPNPPGATSNGCVASGRLSRLQASGNVMVGSEQVLIEDWCQQFPGHSIGSLVFGDDGALYAGGGDAASFLSVDYGQSGDPPNPCGDPPAGVGGVQTLPAAEGGSLRSQDLWISGDPVTLDGAIVRVDPATGAGLPDNPLFSDPDPNARRIIAYGLRNPFRITIRPGSNEVWIGDVGWSEWEEINRVLDPTDAVVENFGWPCYEGQDPQFLFDAANVTLCETLYNTANAVTAPTMRYHRDGLVVPSESCPTGSASVAGLAFAPDNGSPYPAEYDGALFFADYSRDCIWVAFRGGDGLPDFSTIQPFAVPAAGPVDLKISPAGELFYVDFDGGTVRRIRFVSANQPPMAVASANPTSGEAPLNVNFDGTASSDPDPGDTLTYAWDLDGDGQLDDSTATQPVYTYTQSSTYIVTLQVTDSQEATDTYTVVITINNTLPTALVSANPTGGEAPLLVNFDGTGSSDPDPGDTLTYAWDLDGDGQFDDSTASQPVYTYTQSGTYLVTLQVTDSQGAMDTDAVFITINNQPPTAVALADPTGGEAPLNVNFDGTASSDPDPGDTLSYAWDLDGDGQFDDSTASQPVYSYTQPGTYTAALQVIDSLGAPDTDTVAITVSSNTPPTAYIDIPVPGATWKVGDLFTFSGSATDARDGDLPASALSWALILHHCPAICHTHPIQEFAGVAGGSFDAPDHEYPSFLELWLTVTDSGGLTDTTSIELQPQTVELTFQTNPGNFDLVVGPDQEQAPFSRTVIVGSQNSVSAPTPQTKGDQEYHFVSWSDGGAQTHTMTAPESLAIYTARYGLRLFFPIITRQGVAKIYLLNLWD